MKIRINKQTLAQLPEPIREVVSDWRNQYRKTSFDFENRPSFYIEEDARFTAFGPDLKSMTVRAGGEWAGVTALMPGRTCPLPPQCTVVETGFFCGHPYLHIRHNPTKIDGQLPSPLLALG